jgi:hypothetical protein
LDETAISNLEGTGSSTTGRKILYPDNVDGGPGAGMRENVSVDRMIESVDLVPTLATLLGCDARFAAGKPVAEVL